MSSFEDNFDTIVQNNRSELLGVLHQMHALGPAFQAFHKICKDNKIKPLRKRKGQYNPNKRNLSAYNIFTQEVQNDKKLKDKTFQERSKLIGAMWKKVKTNDKEHQKYKDMAADRKKDAVVEVEDQPEPVKAKPKGKAPAKGKKAPAKKKAVVVSDGDVYMSDDSDVMDDSDEDVSD